MLERVHELIKHATVPSESVIGLLENTLIGTKGTLYQLRDTRTKIYRLHKPHFLSIERNEKTIGLVTLCERDISLENKIAESFYIRYFAFDRIFQGGSRKSNKQSNFHHYLNALFATSNLDPIHPQRDKKMFWAFIDPQNERSFNMNVNFGFETIGKYKTKAFSRVNPKNDGVERLKEDDKQEVEILIQSFYRDFNFFSKVHLFEDDNYYVLRKDGEIICGIQANPAHWKIISLPGLSGKLMLRFSKYIPRLRKLVNPNQHKFLATEGLFWKAGYEDQLSKLLEGTLAITKHYSMLLWVDDRNQLLDQLGINWGFIQKMKADNEIHIVAKFNGYTQEEINKIKSKPKYLSGFDMT